MDAANDHTPKPKGRTARRDEQEAQATTRAFLQSQLNSGNRAAQRIARTMLKQLRTTPEGHFYMRIWDVRSREIRNDVRAKGGNWTTVLAVLDIAQHSITNKTQRMTITQAEVATEIGLTAGPISRAFSVLADVGAVLMREQSGKSQTWELDAEYCSKMNDDDREKAMDRQEAWRERMKAQHAEREAEIRRAEEQRRNPRQKFRVVSDDEAAIRDDPRQNGMPF